MLFFLLSGLFLQLWCSILCRNCIVPAIWSIVLHNFDKKKWFLLSTLIIYVVWFSFHRLCQAYFAWCVRRFPLIGTHLGTILRLFLHFPFFRSSKPFHILLIMFLGNFF